MFSSNTRRHRRQAGKQRAGSSEVLAVLLTSVHEQFDAGRSQPYFLTTPPELLPFLDSSLWSKPWSKQQALT